MSARRLTIGEHGTIGFRERPGGGFTAATYYRDPRGLRRRLEASAPSESVARRRLLARFEETMRLGGSAGYDPRTTLKDVAEE